MLSNSFFNPMLKLTFKSLKRGDQVMNKYDNFSFIIKVVKIKIKIKFTKNM